MQPVKVWLEAAGRGAHPLVHVAADDEHHADETNPADAIVLRLELGRSFFADPFQLAQLDWPRGVLTHAVVGAVDLEAPENAAPSADGNDAPAVCVAFRRAHADVEIPLHVRYHAPTGGGSSGTVRAALPPVSAFSVALDAVQPEMLSELCMRSAPTTAVPVAMGNSHVNVPVGNAERDLPWVSAVLWTSLVAGALLIVLRARHFALNAGR